VVHQCTITSVNTLDVKRVPAVQQRWYNASRQHQYNSSTSMPNGHQQYTNGGKSRHRQHSNSSTLMPNRHHQWWYINAPSAQQRHQADTSSTAIVAQQCRAGICSTISMPNRHQYQCNNDCASVNSRTSMLNGHHHQDSVPTSNGFQYQCRDGCTSTPNGFDYRDNYFHDILWYPFFSIAQP